MRGDQLGALLSFDRWGLEVLDFLSCSIGNQDIFGFRLVSNKLEGRAAGRSCLLVVSPVILTHQVCHADHLPYLFDAIIDGFMGLLLCLLSFGLLLLSAFLRQRRQFRLLLRLGLWAGRLGSLGWRFRARFVFWSRAVLFANC